MKLGTATDAPAPERIPFFGTTWVKRSVAYWVRRVLLAVLLLAFLAAAGALATVLWSAFVDLVAPAGTWRTMCWVIMLAACVAALVWGFVYQKQHPHPVVPPSEARDRVRRAGARGARRSFIGRGLVLVLVPVLPAIIARTIGGFIAGTFVREVPNEIGARRDWEERKLRAQR